ncbi:MULTISPECIES: Lrp/AsnC family transcriptional regulator [Enterococcus]|uniref:Lrp/AsnC family transcriptional regulator n=1 Tax=Candidatus Enterococcus murrayae TaxID=2815321 RepID=A0ABS3HQ84_9ENTE|nr:Lrp/AsnC family transcriptional regulator [Enterococcus sp. MJM16]MBO0455055.1 Lrp/AsnC family transcriptional regulator [Enterococcus sp. MJM16]
MDKTDLAILDILKKDSRQSSKKISEMVDLSTPAVIERLRKLENSGVLQQYTIKMDRKKLGQSILAFISVKLDRTGNTNNFKNVITKYPAVLECHKVTGEYDYLLKVAATDLSHLEHFLFQKLKQVRGVGETQTTITLENLKEEINGSFIGL